MQPRIPRFGFTWTVADISHAGPEYPESLVRGHQTTSATPPHNHIQPMGCGGGSPSAWATMDSNLK